MDDDLRAAVAGRTGWRVGDDDVAVYAPERSRWSAWVRRTTDPVKAVTRWHATVVEGGVARHALLCREPGEAAGWAQRIVDAK